MDLGKEEFLNSVKAIETLKKMGGEWQVSSSPFGCKLGYSKVYLRRKRNKPSSLHVYPMKKRINSKVKLEYCSEKWKCNDVNLGFFMFFCCL